MANIKIVMPAMGEGIFEVTITRWFVKEGDWVDEDTPILEVATDKVDSEVPAPISGKISRLIYHEGDIAQIGEVLALIESEQAGEESNDVNLGEVPVIAKETLVSRKPDYLKRNLVATCIDEDLHLTPFMRFLAKDRGVTVEELLQIKGTSVSGRITKDDINNYILTGRPFKKEALPGVVEVVSPGNETSNAYKLAPGEELVEMDRTRQLIAEHMVRSKKMAPHVTSFVEVDVTGLVQWRNENKDRFQKEHGVKLTYTPLIVEATVKALKDFPGINISVAGSHIVKKSDINIGIATALPDGNLIVPVIKQADHCNIVKLASQLNDLSLRARSSNLEPNEIKGGTFTITNMGQYNNITGTPIINQPEVAILAVGSILKKPGVVYIDKEPTMGIRDMVMLVLTYDHRVVDGALGGSFLNAIGKYLSENLPSF